MFKVNDVYIDHLITISLNLDSGAIEKLGTAKAVPAAEVWFHAAFFVQYWLQCQNATPLEVQVF